LASRTRVLLLQHPSETTHALNTARLAALGLLNAELRVGEVFDDLQVLLADPGYRPVLLFPGEQAQVLQPYSQGNDVPLLLVVPDGTWRKARKMLYLNPLLTTLPRVTLGQVSPSRYRLRKAPEPGAVSTIEAVVQALEVLEVSSFADLLRPFEALIDGQIKAMGNDTFEQNHCRSLHGET
jgi:DTW domain-containing protein YfiP